MPGWTKTSSPAYDGRLVGRRDRATLLPVDATIGMMAIVLDLLAAALLIWLAMRRAPLWISVLIILLVCSPWLFGWIAEIDEPDTRPGLLLFGGVLSLAFLPGFDSWACVWAALEFGVLSVGGVVAGLPGRTGRFS